MGYTIRDVRTHELLADTVYSQKSSAKRSFNSRLLTPDRAYIADEDWRLREAARSNLINMEQFGLPNIPDHFLHVSEKSTFEEFLISYTESEVKGRMDRQSPGRKIGRYLKEFYPDMGDRLEKLTHEITAKVNKLPISFARTPDEIRDIYLECGKDSKMESCMTHHSNNWDLRDENNQIRHPTEAYGGGDLALAYMRSSTGRITARVLIWEEKKRYNRLYGPDASKLESLLRSAGYSQDTFSGARLLSVKLPRMSSSSALALMTPYVDRDRYVYLDKDDVLRISNGNERGFDHKGTNTTGYVQFSVTTDVITGEKLTNPLAVYHPRTGDSAYVSRDHYIERTVEYRGYYYAKVDYPTDGNSNNNWIKVEGKPELGLIPYVKARRDYTMSAHSRLWFPRDQIIDANGVYVSVQEFVDHYERCEMTGAVRSRKDMIAMPHGKYWCRDAVALYATVVKDVYHSRYHPQPVQENAA